MLHWTNLGFHDHQTGRYLLGLVFIVLLCFTWIVAGVLTQYLVDELDVQSPFLMSYIGISTLVFLLPLKAWTDRCGLTCEVPVNTSIQSQSTDGSLARELDEAQDIVDYVSIASRRTEQLVRDQRSRWNHRRHVLAALYIAPAMFGADWACNVALANTRLASVTVIVSTQSVLVFLLAVLIRLERYSRWKILGVLLTVAGTALTAFEDAETDQATHGESFYGDLMAFAAAVAFATYTVLVRLFCPEDEDLYSTPLLLGYVGCVCCGFLLPFAIRAGLQQSNWTVIIVGLISIKGILDFVLTEYLMIRAIVLTSATTATVGLGLMIPMALLADWALGKYAESLLSMLGAAAVIAGFLTVNLVAEKTGDVVTSSSSSCSSDEIKPADMAFSFNDMEDMTVTPSVNDVRDTSSTA